MAVISLPNLSRLHAESNSLIVQMNDGEAVFGCSEDHALKIGLHHPWKSYSFVDSDVDQIMAKIENLEEVKILNGIHCCDGKLHGCRTKTSKSMTEG